MGKQNSYQDSSELVVAGRRPVSELLAHASVRCLRLARQEKINFGVAIESLIENAAIPVEQLSREKLDALAGEQHQGLVLWVKTAPFIELEALADYSLNHRRRLVALDCVVDPHNVGAVIRAAEAFAFDGVIVSSDRSAPINMTVRRVSRGSAELLKICRAKNLSRALTELQKLGFWIVGTGLDTTAQSIYDAVIPEPVVVILGSEGDGMRPLTAKQCDLLVTIPLPGRMQSLNVSQAASIVFSEISRRSNTNQNG